MFGLDNISIQSIAQFFGAHTEALGIFTYLIVFSEAMAVIGAIVPGAIIMPAIGFLIGSAVIPAGPTFLYAIAGAVTGDCLSYFIGVYFQDRVHRIWPFTKWPGLLDRSEKFFNDHGGKSIFIGRFVGPIRAMIPMISGMVKMPFSRFLLVSLPSAAIWAVSYMVPGILLGALSLELPPKVAAEFTGWAILVVIALWVLVWIAKHYFKQICRMIDYYVMRAWKYCQQHKKLSWFAKLLSDPKEPDNHLQLTLVIVTGLVFILFLFMLYQVLFGGVLIDLGVAVYHLLRSLRSLFLDRIFMLITFFGDLTVLLIAYGIVISWLWLKKYKYIALHLLSVIVLSGGFIGVLKLFFKYIPRPGGILYDMYTSSFPSAHSTLAIAFYGFLAVVIARRLKPSLRYLPYLIAAVLVSSIAISRSYLGAHWLVDVLSGILSGLLVLLVVTISYRRKHFDNFPVRKFIIFVSAVFLGVWLGYSVIEFNTSAEEYKPIWPHKSVSFNQLIQQGSSEVPLYRTNRFGTPVEVFNLVYIGDPKELVEVLSKQGWVSQLLSLNFQETIQSIASPSFMQHLSLFPQLHHNKKAVLVFTNKTKRKDVVLVLRLWSSDVDTRDNSSPVWIGAVEYHYASANTFSIRRLKDKRSFIGATDRLAKNLSKEFRLWKKDYSFSEQPQEVRGLHWDGKQLIIRSKLPQ